jgi:hypothetical protein
VDQLARDAFGVELPEPQLDVPRAELPRSCDRAPPVEDGHRLFGGMRGTARDGEVLLVLVAQRVEVVP